MPRRTRRSLVWLIMTALLVPATACGDDEPTVPGAVGTVASGDATDDGSNDGDDSGGADLTRPTGEPKAGSDASAEFCEAWEFVDAGLSAERPSDEVIAALPEALDQLLDEAPADRRPIAEAYRDDLLALLELAEAHDWDFESISDPDELQQFVELGGRLATYPATNPLSTYAFDGCAGAEDPTFVLPCAASGFRPVGTQMGPDGTIPPERDPDTFAEERLDDNPAFDRFERRDLPDGDGVEYAFVDSEGTTVAKLEVTGNDADGYLRGLSLSCGTPAGFTSVG